MLGFLSRLFKAEQNEPAPVSPVASPRTFFSPNIPVFTGLDNNVELSHPLPVEVTNNLRKRLRFSLVTDEPDLPKPVTPLWKRLSLGSDRGETHASVRIGSTLGYESADMNGATERMKVRARAELEVETRENRRFSEALREELHRGIMEIPLKTIQEFEADTRDKLGLSLIPADAPRRKKPRLSNLEISTCDESKLPELSVAEQRILSQRKNACILNPPPENPAIFTFLKPRTPAPQPPPAHAPQPAPVHASQAALPAPLHTPAQPAVGNIFATSFETTSRRPGKRR